MSKKATVLSGPALISAIRTAAVEKKADDVTVLNLGRDTGIADWFVICQGDNVMHTRAIADCIRDDLKKLNAKPWHVEGEEEGRWIIMDFSDVVVHVMTPQVREFYRIEDLWKRADVQELKSND
jgi:ribosome-associated protein